MAFWIDHLKNRATKEHAYAPLFATLAVMMAVSSIAVIFINKLGPLQGPRIEPISEVMPRTMEVMG